ncbi:RNA methyltransferase [Ferrimonas aestuarii]|uniref:RNA methyltransferase n=1 Tax=Ferrimonas aestuarii TaxID=2569539 RepID=A0A4U1BW30_9GAMM|nr:RNA methyltransferase [Ferrimonas aestuarii]TKB58644.1 RNA methyltransferase [Ferrimonas aestuarii]
MNQPQVIIGLSNPKSPTNVGAVMRAAGCYGATEVRYSGERYDRAVKFHTDTKKASSHIPLRPSDDLLCGVDTPLSVVCIELVEGATPLPEFEHPEHAIYLFGPEDGSLDKHLVERAEHVVYVPTKGCMNLAATVNVLLYDRMAKSDYARGDELIRRSRDTRNRLKLEPVSDPA